MTFGASRRIDIGAPIADMRYRLQSVEITASA
jgi:hypothetical protein